VKKILLISPYYPPSNLAAVHRTRLFAQHLPSFGWEPIILTVHEDYYEETLNWNLVKLLPQNQHIEKVKALQVTKQRLIRDIGLRGIQNLIEALGSLPKGPVSLTLLVNCSDEIRSYFSAIISANNVDGYVQFLNTVPEQELVSIASDHHIGIASEIPHIINREYSLTNKLFIYLLAGNALVCSNTQAQALFLDSYQGIGFLYQHNDAKSIAGILSNY
jgi:hypothetical protein